MSETFSVSGSFRPRPGPVPTPAPFEPGSLVVHDALMIPRHGDGNVVWAAGGFEAAPGNMVYLRDLSVRGVAMQGALWQRGRLRRVGRLVATVELFVAVLRWIR